MSGTRPQVMSWLRIIPETTYSYKAAVRFGPSRALFLRCH